MNTYSSGCKKFASRVRLNLHAFGVLLLVIGITLVFTGAASAQQWEFKNGPFQSGSGNCLLLTDGTVIVQDIETPTWYKLTPDKFGSYVNGTWSQIGQMPFEQGQPYAPLYYGSAVLADGRVVVAGGEYDGPFSGEVWFNGTAIYDPIANVWSQLPPTGWPNIGDAASCVLPNGQWMLQDPLGFDAMILDPTTLTWSSPTPPRNGNYGKADGNDEEGWTLLPDGTILTVDTTAIPNSEIFDYIYGDWYTAGSTNIILPDAGTEEMGPQVLRPDGTVIAFGAIGTMSLYNWIGSTTQSPAPGTWRPLGQLPLIGFPPSPAQCEDAPACLLPNGNVLVVTSPGTFESGLAFFELDATTNRIIAEPQDNNAANTSCYECNLLTLPTGQIMMTNFSGEVEFYDPKPGYNPAWAPAITSSPEVVTPGQTYTLYGTQFNGLSQGSAYGDDEQNATNYPLVQVTMNTTGHVLYYRTHDHSTMAVATGNTLVSTNFDVPVNAELGAAQMEVVTNGIPSLPVAVNIVAPPVAVNQTVNVMHNMPANITMTGTDPTGLPLVFVLATQPTNGTLSNFNPSTGQITYTPNNDYQGLDSFTFTVSDGALTSQTGTITLIVAPGTPIANPQSDAVGHDAGLQLQLTGSDPTDAPPPPLKFAIATSPKHGTLSFFNANRGTVTYLPNANFQGADSFTFTVNNGVTSQPAAVTLTVAPAIPYANPQVVGCPKNAPKTITLVGTDPDVPALPLTYAIFSTPVHGTLSGLNKATGVVTYTPAAGFTGNDVFAFIVSNAANQSAPAVVTVEVAPGTPVASPQTVAVAHNTAKAITLLATDPDKPALPLTYAIAASPTHGTLSGFNAATGAVTYTPAANYQGNDSFTFTANNGLNTSLPATVTLKIAPGIPTASPQSVTVNENKAKGITLVGSDPDIPALRLTYAIASGPSHGKVGINASTGAVTYTPNANYVGSDSFTFTVSNGTNTSTPATVSITVEGAG